MQGLKELKEIANKLLEINLISEPVNEDILKSQIEYYSEYPFYFPAFILKVLLPHNSLNIPISEPAWNDIDKYVELIENFKVLSNNTYEINDITYKESDEGYVLEFSDIDGEHEFNITLKQNNIDWGFYNPIEQYLDSKKGNMVFNWYRDEKDNGLVLYIPQLLKDYFNEYNNGEPIFNDPGYY